MSEDPTAPLRTMGQSNVTATWDFELVSPRPERDHCRVYWGSHGCIKGRSHEGLHECDCCDCPNHRRNLGARIDEDGYSYMCVATWPYYGGTTLFYGDDAPTLSPSTRRKLERDWARAGRCASLIHGGRKPGVRAR